MNVKELLETVLEYDVPFDTELVVTTVDEFASLTTGVTIETNMRSGEMVIALQSDNSEQLDLEVHPAFE